jgi:hypothetical protein
VNSWCRCLDHELADRRSQAQSGPQGTGQRRKRVGQLFLESTQAALAEPRIDEAREEAQCRTDAYAQHETAREQSSDDATQYYQCYVCREDPARIDEQEELARLEVRAFGELGPVARHRGDANVDDEPREQGRGDGGHDG